MRDDSRTRPVGRLTKRKQFVAAASGRRFHTDRMSAQGLPRSDDEGLRVGLTVTRKVGHATERNRIKRRLRAVVRALSAEQASLAADVVLVARRSCLQADQAVLIDDVARALRVVTKPRSSPSGSSGSRSSGRPQQPTAKPDFPPNDCDRGSPHA